MIRRAAATLGAITALAGSTIAHAANPVVHTSGDITGTTTGAGTVFGSNCTSSRGARASEEAATLPLMDGWASAAVAAGFERLSLAPAPADGVSGDSASLSFIGTDVTVTVSRRQLTAGQAAAGSSSVGSLSSGAVFSDAVRLQDCAPRPADLATAPAGATLLSGPATLSGLAAGRATFWNATSFPAGNAVDAALFQFSEPVGAFGAWFADLETRHPDPSGGGVLARVRLFDASGSVVADDPVLPDEGTTDDTVCGGPSTTDGLGCGNQSTRFVGFVDPDVEIAAMLVIVGDDDSCVQTTECDAVTEALAFIGPTLGDLRPPELTVTVDTDLAAVPETGGTVTFTVTITNPSPEPVTVTSLSDSVLGPLGGVGTCALPVTLPARGGTAACTYTATLSGQPGVDRTAVVTVGGTGDITGEPTSDDDDVVTSFLDVLPTATLTKTPSVEAIEAPGGPVTFTIALTNTGPEAFTVEALTDSVFGDLAGQGTCAVGAVVAPGATLTCEFTADVAVQAGDGETAPVPHENTVTAAVSDDDGNSVDPTATARVNPVPATTTTTTTTTPPPPGPTTTVSPVAPTTTTASPPTTTPAPTTADPGSDVSGSGTSATTTTSTTTTPTTAPAVAVGGDTLALTGTGGVRLVALATACAAVGVVALMVGRAARRGQRRST